MKTIPEFGDHPYSLKMNPPTYRAHCHYVVDGDTADFLVDLGFGASMTVRVRFLNVRAPEVHGATKADGERWKARVKELLENQPALLKTQDSGMSMERWLAEVYCWDAHVNGFVRLAPILSGEFGPFNV